MTPRFREPDWSEAEIELLAEVAYRPLAMIQKILRRHGFQRSQTAIKVKMTRSACIDRTDPDHLSAHGIARLLGLDGTTVARWIRLGWLPACRRGTARLPQQGGDSWWVHRRDLRAFIVAHPENVDLRKVQQYAFIHLLAGEALR